MGSSKQGSSLASSLLHDVAYFIPAFFLPKLIFHVNGTFPSIVFISLHIWHMYAAVIPAL